VKGLWEEVREKREKREERRGGGEGRGEGNREGRERGEKDGREDDRGGGGRRITYAQVLRFIFVLRLARLPVSLSISIPIPGRNSGPNPGLHPDPGADVSPEPGPNPGLHLHPSADLSPGPEPGSPAGEADVEGARAGRALFHSVVIKEGGRRILLWQKSSGVRFFGKFIWI
jgi:hypothetical protein